jgi:predicted XRE-type DNA-binding protein
MKPPTMKGRPRKLKRDLAICKMVDEQSMVVDGRMTLKEIAEIFKVSQSRVSHIIRKNWKTYTKGRNSQSNK